MRKIIAKQLRKRAYELSENKTSEKDNIIHKRKIKEKIGDKIKESIINLITERYKQDSPISIYRKLKKKWNATPKHLRNINTIKA